MDNALGYLLIAVGPVVTVEKPERFLRRLFQAAVEIIKKKSPKATFFDFHGCSSFHRLPFLSFLLLFSFFVKNPISSTKIHARIAYRPRSSVETTDAIAVLLENSFFSSASNSRGEQ